MEPIAVRRLAREFARAEVNPNAAGRNRESRFPAEAWRKLGDFGIFGPPRTAGMQCNEPERFAFRDRCSNLDCANADPDPCTAKQQEQWLPRCSQDLQFEWHGDPEDDSRGRLGH
jgi:alkylation response protein AidB-like acyl-CoA dehydrogenase